MMSNVIPVDFGQEPVMAFQDDHGIYFALKPIVEDLGLAWGPVEKRLREDPILCEGAAVLARTPDEEILGLRADLIPGWYFTLDDSLIPDPVARERLLDYKRECIQIWQKVPLDAFDLQAFTVVSPKRTARAEKPRSGPEKADPG